MPLFREETSISEPFTTLCLSCDFPSKETISIPNSLALPADCIRILPDAGFGIIEISSPATKSFWPVTTLLTKLDRVEEYTS